MQFLSLPLSIERFRNLQELRLKKLFTQGLPEHATLTTRVRWPLYFLPIVMLNQLLTPHPVWIVLFVALVGLYGSAIFWVRMHARHVTLSHQRLGDHLIVGDTFQEEFEIHNNFMLPVLWVELEDHSIFPSKTAGQIAACGGNTNYRWRRMVECRQRGVYRLGPYGLVMSDPFGLLELRLQFSQEEVIVIYPRVVQIPHGKFPHGQSTGTDRRRRSILGAVPAYSVLEYQPGDSLRRVHWRVTAHRGRLMVRELETEPTGDIWIVLDLHAGSQLGEGALGSLEFGIVTAASLAASLLSGTEGRAVGLLTHSGATQTELMPAAPLSAYGDDFGSLEGGTVSVRPKSGNAQLWQILTALAPVQPGPIPLSEVLSGSREFFGPRTTLIIITSHVSWPEKEPATSNGAGSDMARTPIHYWPADLLHLRSGGLDAYSILIAPEPSSLGVGLDMDAGAILDLHLANAGRLQEQLIAQRIQTSVIKASVEFTPVMTHRRKRTVARSTPAGGLVTYDIDEEVG